MKKYKLLVLLILSVLFVVLLKLLTSINSSESEQINSIDKIEKNGLMPFFLYSDDNPTNKIFENKDKIDVSTYKDKIVIINFWASWCESCVEEFPSFIRLIQKNENDVVLIAISLDETKDLMLKFATDNNLLGQSGLFFKFDNSEMKNYFLINKIPETFIFSKGFKFEKKVVGSIDWSSQEILDFIQKLKK